MRLRNIRGSKDVIASCPFVVQEPESCRGRWAEVFGNENPIHIEVGMGKRTLPDGYGGSASGDQLHWH